MQINTLNGQFSYCECSTCHRHACRKRQGSVGGITPGGINCSVDGVEDFSDYWYHPGNIQCSLYYIYVLLDYINGGLEALLDGFTDIPPVGPVAGGVVVLEGIVKTIGVFIQALRIIEIGRYTIGRNETPNRCIIVPGVIVIVF